LFQHHEKTQSIQRGCYKEILVSSYDFPIRTARSNTSNMLAANRDMLKQTRKKRLIPMSNYKNKFLNNDLYYFRNLNTLDLRNTNRDCKNVVDLRNTVLKRQIPQIESKYS